MMRLAWLGTWVALGAALLGPAPPARAQDARAVFEQGMAAYEDGRFDEALSLFHRAHEMTGEPDVLFNIGAVLDRLRRDEEAVSVYRRYLVERPDSPDRDHVEARIRVLEQAIAARRVEEARETPAAPGDDEAPAAEPGDAAARPVELAPRDDLGGGHGPGAAPWIVLSTGVAVAAGGGVLLWLSQVDAETVRTGTQWHEIRDAHERVPVLSTAGVVLLGLGGAAIAAGLSLP